MTEDRATKNTLKIAKTSSVHFNLYRNPKRQYSLTDPQREQEPKNGERLDILV